MNHQATIRSAKKEDISKIAAVHIQSWKETYPGIMPERKIASLNMEACSRNCENALASGSHVFVAEVNQEIIGFVSGGANRIQEACETGLGNTCEAELAAIYMLREYHGKGIGRMMFTHFVDTMVQAGYHSMVIWVAELNPAVNFYLKMGGEQVDRKILYVCEEPVPVIAFRYWI